MGTSFTPGLTISGSTTVRKVRRLPVRGEVLVGVGDRVQPETIVARVDIAGTLAVAKAAQSLGCAPEQLRSFCKRSEGDPVSEEQVLAERSLFFGLFTNRCRSPRDGTIEYISQLSGHIGVRGNPTPVTCSGYIAGTVVQVLTDEGVVVETTGALIQGIFGVGGERHGTLLWADDGAEGLLGARIDDSHRGRILVHPGRIDASALQSGVEHGVTGLVGASIVDSDLMAFLGFDIGVAITGEERIPFSLILTEGFGRMEMPVGTRRLLQSLSGRTAAINGATQIRAGVIRPEIIVPLEKAGQTPTSAAQELQLGTPVRLIRRPHFGRSGSVTGLPGQPLRIATGSEVRVLSVRLDDGSEVIVPRANVEILDAGFPASGFSAQ